MTETWLRDHLIRCGHLTESGLTRKARLRPCPSPRCRQLVLAGLDDDRCAMEARADPVPLSALGEALAVVEGRRTYSLRHEGGGWILDARDHHKITFAPAGTRPHLDVVRQHRCETEQPAGALAIPSSYPETRPPAPAGAIPPF